jgi:glycosyltransferase involved in cell wall biosynthesis
MNLKVLVIITGGLMNDGITLSQINMFDVMDKNDMDIAFAAVNGCLPNIADKIERAGCCILRLPNRTRLRSYFVSLIRLLKKEKFDIVHIHGSSAIMSIELLAAYIAKVRIRIAHSRNTANSHPLIDKLLRPIFHALTTKRLACGTDAGRFLFGKRSFDIIHNGIRLEHYAFNETIRKEIRAKLNIVDETVIGHIGGFNEQKNQKILIDVFAELCLNSTSYILCLIGDGETLIDCKTLVGKYGISDKVIFLGIVENVNDYDQAFDIVCFPSLFEGLPNVVIEWQAAGLPIILSDAITTECAITPLCEYLPLYAGADVWAKRIHERLCESRDRKYSSFEAVSAIRKNAFDISTTAESIKRQYYAEMQNSEGIGEGIE